MDSKEKYILTVFRGLFNAVNTNEEFHSPRLSPKQHHSHIESWFEMNGYTHNEEDLHTNSLSKHHLHIHKQLPPHYTKRI